MGAIRAKIASGALGVGDRAPSIRGCARSLGVSPSTVVEAYDRLEAEGVIQGRRGSGFYVARADAQPLVIAPIEETRERDLDPFWISKQSLDADPSKPGDNLGYAAFGHVVEGMDVIHKILDQPADPAKGPFKGEMLAAPVKILSAKRVAVTN